MNVADLVRAMFTVLSIWVFLVFVNPISQSVIGRQFSSAELGIASISIFIASLIAAELTIRAIRRDDQNPETE